VSNSRRPIITRDVYNQHDQTLVSIYQDIVNRKQPLFCQELTLREIYTGLFGCSNQFR